MSDDSQEGFGTLEHSVRELRTLAPMLNVLGYAVGILGGIGFVVCALTFMLERLAAFRLWGFLMAIQIALTGWVAFIQFTSQAHMARVLLGIEDRLRRTKKKDFESAADSKP